MKISCILVVFACYVPSSSSFRVQLQRCTSSSSTMMLQASATTATEIAVILHQAVSDYDGLTVISLKELLRKRGLKVSGLKEELKTRLREDDTKYHIVPTENDVSSTSEITSVDNSRTIEDELLNLLFETAFNDRKFKDQQIQEEQKNIVSSNLTSLVLKLFFHFYM